MPPLPDHGENSYDGSRRLSGRQALITAGDSGLGRAAAIAFAREGADVAIGYLPEEEEEDAREVVALVGAAGRNAAALPGEMRDEAFCRKRVDGAEQALGGLDILCNNAARQYHASILEISNEDLEWTLKTNRYALFWISKAAVPRMRPGSAIIDAAFVTAWEAPQNLVDYPSTKGAIVTFTKALAKQLVERGIRVNAIAPGPFGTPLQPGGGQPPDKLTQFGADTPMKRPGQPVELAPLFVTLAPDDASFTTGSVSASTGGEAAN